MLKFKVGDYVYYETSTGKFKGVIRRLPTIEHVGYAVEILMDQAEIRLHSCDGYIPSGRGRWAYEDSLSFVHTSWPPKASRRKYKGFEKCTQLKS